jgi:hypothetical protein
MNAHARSEYLDFSDIRPFRSQNVFVRRYFLHFPSFGRFWFDEMPDMQNQNPISYKLTLYSGRSFGLKAFLWRIQGVFVSVHFCSDFDPQYETTSQEIPTALIL